MADERVYTVSGPLCVWKLMAEDEDGGPLYEEPLAPSKSGYLSLRIRGKSATSMLDGSTALRSMQELADMRLWTNQAWKPDWVLDLQNP